MSVGPRPRPFPKADTPTYSTPPHRQATSAGSGVALRGLSTPRPCILHFLGRLPLASSATAYNLPCARRESRLRMLGPGAGELAESELGFCPLPLAVPASLTLEFLFYKWGWLQRLGPGHSPARTRPGRCLPSTKNKQGSGKKTVRSLAHIKVLAWCGAGRPGALHDQNDCGQKEVPVLQGRTDTS